MKVTKADTIAILALVVFVSFFIIFSPRYIGMQTAESAEYECGDSICTAPFEDEIVCPEDCANEFKFPYLILVIVLILLVLGLIYFNLYKGKKDLRDITRGKMPYTNIKDYDNLKGFVSKEINLGTKLKDITLKLAEKGWTKKQIEFVYDDLLWEKRKVLIDLTPKQSRNKKELIEYLTNCKKLNVDEKTARLKLLEKGWDKDAIKDALKQVNY
jgi:hypothetical protein